MFDLFQVSKALFTLQRKSDYQIKKCVHLKWEIYGTRLVEFFLFKLLLFLLALCESLAMDVSPLIVFHEGSCPQVCCIQQYKMRKGDISPIRMEIVSHGDM